jgi:hypothetical protein
MSNSKPIVVAKLMALIGFLSLVVCTYYLRSEVLALSHIRFSADEVSAANDLKQVRESYPDRIEQHEAAMKHYELETEHYRKMLDLYQNNYDEYVKRIEGKYKIPPLPRAPTKPTPPEVAETLYEINADFRVRKSQYFAASRRLNWFACGAALMLVGGLLYLLMFDANGQRWHYLVALVISFVFLIGPAFHSIMTGIIGFLAEPGVD